MREMEKRSFSEGGRGYGFSTKAEIDPWTLEITYDDSLKWF
jgi:hypothetical protein